MITYLAPPPAHTGPFTDDGGRRYWPVSPEARPDPWHTHGPVTAAHLVALYALDQVYAERNVIRVLCDHLVDTLAAPPSTPRGLSIGEIRDRTLHGLPALEQAIAHCVRAGAVRREGYRYRVIPDRVPVGVR